MWAQEILTIHRTRGMHLITDEVTSLLSAYLPRIEIGILFMFCMHTSCSISINENCDPDVRMDLEDTLNRIVPEGNNYRHDAEGSDDMPAHIKSSLLGVNLFVPIKNGRLMLGTWQGIYFGEHRNHGGNRQIVLTLQGKSVN